MTKIKDPAATSLTYLYAELIRPILPLAKKAFGSRGTVSPQHDASRMYTALLVEYYGKGGSLLDICKALDVTYAGVRRRVTTDEITPTVRRSRTHYTTEQYAAVVARVQTAKESSTAEYHRQIKIEHDAGVSLNHLATLMGLSSANPLYYGVSRVILREMHEMALPSDLATP